MGEHPVDVPVGRDEPGRRLLPHPGHPGEVVGGVTAKGRVLRVLLGHHPRPLLYPGLVVEDVVAHAPAVVEHPDVGVLDELVGVPVAGHDDDVVAPVPGLGGQGGDDVVGLEARHLHHRYAQRLHHLADQAHLLAEDVGGLGPPRLVVGHQLVAEGGLGTVEGYGYAFRAVVLEQVHEHGGEAEDGVGHLTRHGRHVRGKGEEGPVGQGVAVEQEQLRHRRHRKSEG